MKMGGNSGRTKGVSLTLFPFLLLLPGNLSHAGHAKDQPDLTCSDLATLVQLFQGEFDNFHQNVHDKSNGSMGRDFHSFIQKYHVPIMVPDLLKTSRLCREETRQVYLEQYFDEKPSPQRQRIFNFILKNNRIIMETRRARNSSLLEHWQRWRGNVGQFERLRAEQLQFSRRCNVEWIKIRQDQFQAKTLSKNCVFNFQGVQVYLQSEVDLFTDRIVQDEKFISVESKKVVSGTITPYVFRRRNSAILALSSRGNHCQWLRCRTCNILKRYRTESGKIKVIKDLMTRFPFCFPYTMKDLRKVLPRSG